jgi:hypothetical protein
MCFLGESLEHVVAHLASLPQNVVLEALLLVVVCTPHGVSAPIPTFAWFRLHYLGSVGRRLADALLSFCSGGCFAAAVTFGWSSL